MTQLQQKERIKGYDDPQGYFTVIRHVYNDPNFRVSLFCKPGVKIVATCQIYDGSSPNTAHLIGIEYIITAKDYSLNQKMILKDSTWFCKLCARTEKMKEDDIIDRKWQWDDSTKSWVM